MSEWTWATREVDCLRTRLPDHLVALSKVELLDRVVQQEADLAFAREDRAACDRTYADLRARLAEVEAAKGRAEAAQRFYMRFRVRAQEAEARLAEVEAEALEAVDGVERIAHGAREGPRYGVTGNEARLYDKGFDDALSLVRSALALRGADTA